MDKETLLSLLRPYGVESLGEWREIDSTCEGDYRLNVIADRRYVLRINDPVITEERLAAIDRLAGRYRAIGVAAPRLYRTAAGTYRLPCGERVCYLSEYLPEQTLEEAGDSVDKAQVRREVLQSVGRLSREFTGQDLSAVYSMWTILDLAPLDKGIDEKQENLNDLVAALDAAGMGSLARQVNAFNEEVRGRIRAVYKHLPRCVIQGDLNDQNILVRNGHFFGLIDFNMAGTEVNVNHFCAETNDGISDEDFSAYPARQLYTQWCARQAEQLQIIAQEYSLNELEKAALPDYRAIARISQYPNVCSYRRFLQQDAAKAARLIELVIG